MRIKLKKGKQAELITLAKKDKTWLELSKELDIVPDYIRNELRKEKRLLSEKVYLTLCELTKTNYEKFIEEKLNDNWGRLKGGLNSEGNTKKIKLPRKSEYLSELIGTILGDGHIESYTKGTKIRCYSITITGDSRNDKEYLSNYITNIIKKLFREDTKIKESEDSNTLYLRVYGKEIVKFLNNLGLKSGNKKENNQSIPKWIKNNKNYLIPCLRGLVDTDGSIHYISKNNKNLRISFTSYIPNLLNDVRNSLIKLGFNPSKIINEKQIFLSRKENIERYIKTIGFSNEKHLNRIKKFNSRAPVV